MIRTLVTSQIEIAKRIADHNGNCGDISCDGESRGLADCLVNPNIPCPYSGTRCSKLDFIAEYKKLLEKQQRLLKKRAGVIQHV